MNSFAKQLLLTSALVLAAALPAAALAQTTPAEAPTTPAAQAAPAPDSTPAQEVAPAPDAAAAPEAAPAPETAPAAEAAAPAQPAAAAGTVSPPPAGKGQVVFWRPSKYMGMALSFSVHEGQKGVAKLGNGSYVIHVTDPGSHTYTIQSEVKDDLTLEVEAGETYYVEQSIGMGIMMGRPHLAPSEESAFAAKKLKESKKVATDLKAAG
jgi:hypothetical protein